MNHKEPVGSRNETLLHGSGVMQIVVQPSALIGNWKGSAKETAEENVDEDVHGSDIAFWPSSSLSDK